MKRAATRLCALFIAAALIFAPRAEAAGKTGSENGLGDTLASTAIAELGRRVRGRDPATNPYVAYMGVDGDWCMGFVMYCLDLCGCVEEGLVPETYSCSVFFRSVTGAPYNYYYCTVRNSAPFSSDPYAYEPQPGDIYLEKSRDETGWAVCSHAAIIVGSGEGYIDTADGNIEDATRLMHRTASYGDSFLDGYIVHIRGFGENSYADYAGMIFDWLTEEKGLSLSAACGILGNIQRESECVPDREESYRRGENAGKPIGRENGGGYGLIAWRDEKPYAERPTLAELGGEFRYYEGYRRTNFENYCLLNDLNPASLYVQLEYLGYETELVPEYGEAFARLRAVPDTPEGALEAAGIFSEIVMGGGEASERESFTRFFRSRFLFGTSERAETEPVTEPAKNKPENRINNKKHRYFPIILTQF